MLVQALRPLACIDCAQVTRLQPGAKVIAFYGLVSLFLADGLNGLFLMDKLIPQQISKGA